MKRHVLTAWLCLAFVSTTALAGCWDYHELEDRAVIVGIGIDELPPKRHQGKEMRMYQLILQVVEPSGQGGDRSQGGLGGGKQETRGFSNFIISTPSIAEGIESIVTRSDRLPNVAHLQLIALGEKVAKKGINELYDFFTRYPQMRRHTEIAVVTGSLLPYFETPSISEPTPAIRMADMLNRVQHTLLMPEGNLGTVSRHVRGEMPFLLLKATLDARKQIVLEQAAVFNVLKMVGTLDKNQMQDISLLQDEIERGVLDFPCSDGKMVGIQILNGNIWMKPSIRNGRPHIHFRLKLDTELMEYQCLGATFDKQEQIRRAEKVFSSMIRKRLIKTVQALKTKYRADLFRFTPRLKNDPELYDWIRNRPGDFFQKLDVDVEVHLHIRDIGNALQSPKRKLRP